ncbi:MAG: ATP-binding cassette domain-containing protein [Bacilli bacterium]|nr:ATP-binding cassette domain-containing protein [Bacilli bacterium]MDD4411654.1 ATP-binding cassette domain-containing protein [Bacilli bacterium]
MIKVNIKSKIYKMKSRDVKALENINFELENNGLVCILGPSGSGKTTLMNIIGALDSDFSGDVIINDKSLKKVRSEDLDSYRKNAIGFIFQQFYLLNQFSIYDNIELALALSNVKNKKERIMKLLEDVEMDSFANRKVNVLSGGQKQRVAIARALANNPDIILADEPTGSLDSRMGHEIMTKLKDLSKEKLVLVITHSEELVEEFADTVIRLEDGKIKEIVKKNDVKAIEVEAKEETRSVMSYCKAFTHSIKSLWQKKGRTLATGIGMSIGIIGIALAFALSNGSSQLIKSQVDSILPANNLSVYPKGELDNNGVSINFSTSDLDMFSYEDLEYIMKLDERIETYWPVPTNTAEEFFSEVSLSKNDATSSTFEENSVYLMNGPEPYETLNNNLTLGRAPENKNEIVISLTTAEALLSDDKNIDSLVDKDLYIKFGPNMSVGRDDERNQVLTFKIVGITSINTMGYSVYQNVDDLLSLYENLFSIKRNDMKFIQLLVYLDSDLRNDEIKAAVEELNNQQDKFTFVGAAESMMDGVQTFMDTVRNVLIGFSSISVVVAILMIGIVIYISVIERIDEIGILRAIGARKKDIRNLFLSESMIIGLLAGTLGVLISVGICSIINATVAFLIRSYGMQLGNISVAVLDPMVALALILTCIILALIAGVIPSLKAAKMDPIMALRKK